MEESLAWLRAPETQPALGDLLCGLIRDIRLILVHADLGTAAKLGAITETVDQLAPPPGPNASGAQAAASVVALRLVHDDSTRIQGGRVSVTSSARMWLADAPVALASERVTAELCQRAAVGHAIDRA